MKKPNVIILLLDAVRTKNLSIYGYHKDTTPNMSKILTDSTLYKNMISSSYWTMPSVASLFTGTYVSEHYLVHNGDKLTTDLTTIAEKLKELGYYTLGISPNPFASGYSGLDRGFDVFENFYDNSFKHKVFSIFNKYIKSDIKKPNNITEEKKDKDNIFTKFSKKIYWELSGLSDKFARKTNNEIVHFIKNHDRNIPFFIYAHYNESHTPFVIPNKYRYKFLNKENKKEMWKIEQDLIKYYMDDDLNIEDARLLEEIYEGSINYLDNTVYNLYKFLEKEKILDNTIFIITSDHGDQFGEHGLVFHEFSLYETLIKVPLIIRYPKGYPKNIVNYDIVQNVDIFPTILDVINESENFSQLQGNSLISDSIKNRDNFAISELYKPLGPRLVPYKNKLLHYDKKLLSIRTENKKFIYSSDGVHELYDIKKDPNEVNNIYEKNYDIESEFGIDSKKWIDKFELVSEYSKSLLELRSKVIK